MVTSNIFHYIGFFILGCLLIALTNDSFESLNSAAKLGTAIGGGVFTFIMGWVTTKLRKNALMGWIVTLVIFLLVMFGKVYAHGGGLNVHKCHNKYDDFGNIIEYHCH